MLKKKHKKSISLIAHSSPKSPITEQYRQIRSNLYFSSRNKEIKTIVVTSPEPSDGKTTTAANLAIVIAQQGKQVLLVDADLRKPSAHYAFNMDNIHGLTSVLMKKIGLNLAISNTHVPNLDILTSGPTEQYPSELLNSKSMETMMKELKDMYEFIIFDTPPVLAVTDSQILANICDGVVMVVAAGKTSKEGTAKAKYLLDKAKSQFLGVVVNEVDTINNGYYY